MTVRIELMTIDKLEQSTELYISPVVYIVFLKFYNLL